MEAIATGPWTVVRYLGGWGHHGGPGRFMLQMLFVGVGTASVIGLSGSMFAALLFETAALPFMVSAIFGFGVGCVSYYRRSITQALIALDRYPTLLRLHLDAQFPTERYDQRPLGFFNRRTFDQTWQNRSRAIVGWLSAADSIAAIRARQEQQIIDSDDHLPSRDEKVPI